VTFAHTGPAERACLKPTSLLPGRGEQFPVPLGDDFDRTVGHFDSGLYPMPRRRFLRSMPSESTPELRGRQALDEVIERALRCFLRGGTWPGIAREIAWLALRVAEADHTRLNGLTTLVEARLAQTIDGLLPTVESVWIAASEDHLRSWPHDREGAERIALLDGYEEAMRVLSRQYVEVLEWSVTVIGERRGLNGQSGRRWPRLGTSDEQFSKVELPALVVQGLRRRIAPFGWSRRDAA
jgi:hypothetical protein